MDKLEVRVKCEDIFRQFCMNRYGTDDYENILEREHCCLKTFEFEFEVYHKGRALIFFFSNSILLKIESAFHADYKKEYPISANSIKNACRMVDRKGVEYAQEYLDHILGEKEKNDCQ